VVAFSSLFTHFGAMCARVENPALQSYAEENGTKYVLCCCIGSLSKSCNKL